MPYLRPSRRDALMAAAGLLSAGSADAASNQTPPETGIPGGAAVVVAGPHQGRLDRWADLLLPAITRAMPGAMAQTVARSTVGGADGVTGANQFEAHIPPDGGTALLLPGTAATAWLVGDPRAQFDAARWIPAWAGMASAVLVSRMPLAPGRTLRVRGAHPAGPGLPMLLALDLMRIEVTPATTGDADAVFHWGQGARFAAMSEPGMVPVLSLGAIGQTGAWLRDPAFAGVPTAIESAAAMSSPALLSHGLLAALRATSAATMLDVALVLPQLSPANRVALWRRACTEASASAELQTEAASLGIRPAPAPASATLTAAIAADVPTLLALRSWLDTRWGWRPT